jgi:hypothetical protein
MDGHRMSGFYAASGNGVIHAPNRVCAPTFELHRDLKDTYTYPVGGWTWFDSEAEARIAFGLPPAPERVDPRSRRRAHALQRRGREKPDA